MKKKIICIVGPTASGKTKLAVDLAKKLSDPTPSAEATGGEIISADSRQVYRGLDIGTGKDLKEYGKVKYHLIDIADTEEKFTMFDWLELARKKIDDIFSRGKVPIVVGGTGLYTQALVEGFELEKVKNPRRAEPSGRSQIPKYTRVELEKLSLKQLRNIYRKLKIENSKIDLNNPHRLIRAIEKAQSGVVPTKKKPDFETLQIGINLPRKKLYGRIDKRVDERFEKEKMLEEVEELLANGVDSEWLMSLGLEYRIISNFILSNPKLPVHNSMLFKEMTQELKFKSHAFARRQLTWFRRFPEIKWVTNKKEASVAVDNYLNI